MVRDLGRHRLGLLVDKQLDERDRGCQYTAEAYRHLCVELGVTQSMASVGDSHDNAMAGSLRSGFKRAAVDCENFATKAEARAAIFAWITWYSTTRLSSAIDQRPPIEYEQMLADDLLAT